MATPGTGGGVLVPGVTAPSSVTCVRSLGRRGISVVVGSESPGTPAASSRYCEEFVQLPDPFSSLDRYAEALHSIAQRSNIETIIPVREADIYVLSRYREVFADEVATPWPTFETLQRVQDRVKLFDAAEAADVSIPETELATQWDDWNREVIVKPRYTVPAPAYLGQNAEQVEIGSTDYRNPGTKPDLTALQNERGHVPLVQEYVDDTDEYGFFALYDEGEPLATFQHRQRRGYKYCGGPSAYRESVDIPELDEAGRALLDHLDWHGLAMVEFLRNPETGEFELMEVNPRFWSSLPFTVQAGVDFPLYYWQLAQDHPIPTPPDYEVGRAGHLLRGELCYLHSVLTEEYRLVERPSILSALGDVVRTLVDDPHFDYPALDDPEPFVRDLVRSVRSDETDSGSETVGSDGDWSWNAAESGSPDWSDGKRRATDTALD